MMEEKEEFTEEKYQLTEREIAAGVKDVRFWISLCTRIRLKGGKKWMQ
jgi:hypothetical protein